MDTYHDHFIRTHFFWWVFWLMLIIPFFFIATPVRSKTARLYGENSFGNLQRRYAAGELTPEAYEERKSRIERDLRDPTSCRCHQIRPSETSRRIQPSTRDR